jgi:hypothetical protein
MANPWDNDPIIQPAPAATPWANDPVVQPSTSAEQPPLGPVGVAAGTVGAITHGLSFGLDSPLDKLTAYLFPNSAFAKLQPGREQQRTQFETEHPVLNAAGEAVGSIPTYAMGEGALRAVVPVAQGAGALSTTANLAGSAVRNAAVSGAQAAGTTEGDPLEAAKRGAVVGAVAGPAADLAGQGMQAGWRAIRGNAGGLSVPEAQLGQLALQKYGIPITAPDLSNNMLYRTGTDQLGKLPFSGAAPAAAAKQAAWQGAIANQIGETGATSFTSNVMDRAATRIGTVFNDVATRTSIPPAETTQLVQDLDGVLHNAQRVLQAGEIAPLETQIKDLKALISDNNGTISGDAYQRLTNAKSLLSRLERQNSNTGDFAGDVRDALDDAFSRSAAPADQQALQQARYQYRVMRTVDQLAAGSRDGNISPDAFMQKVLMASRKYDAPLGGVAYTGGGDIGELARIGKLMRAPPQTGSADRALINFATTGLAGGSAFTANPLMIGAVPAALAANRMGGAYLRSGGLANRLIEGTLNPSPFQPRAISPVVTPVVNQLFRR